MIRRDQALELDNIDSIFRFLGSAKKRQLWIIMTYKTATNKEDDNKGRLASGGGPLK